MIDELQTALKHYQDEWVNWCKDNTINAQYTPTAVGWKVADIEQFKACFNELLVSSSQLHIADVDRRKIGSFVLYEPLPMQIRVVKLMQRRSGSNDALGLDHVDFTVTNTSEIEAQLTEKNILFEWEANEMHKWISVRYKNNKEAKFFDHTVLDIGALELTQASKELL